MLSMKIFLERQENDLGVLALTSKNSIMKTTTTSKQPTLLSHNQHQLNFGMMRVQYLGHGKGYTDLL